MRLLVCLAIRETWLTLDKSELPVLRIQITLITNRYRYIQPAFSRIF